MKRMWRSLRFRVTAAATFALAIVLAVAAVFIVNTVEHQLHNELADQNDATLDDLTRRLEGGESPDSMVLPVGGDGTEFEIADADGYTIQATFVVRDTAIDPETGEEIFNPALDVFYSDETLWTVSERSVTAPDGTRYDVLAYSPNTVVDRTVNQVRSVLWFVIPILALVFGFGVWITVTRALRPVSEMTTEARRISTETMHDRLPRPGTGDEIDELALTLNGMLDRIQHGVDRQREFVDDASHELQSPLTAIIGEAQLAATDPTLVNLHRANEITVREGQRLTGLVSDLLGLAVVDQTQPRLEDVDLDDIALEQARLSTRTIVTKEVRPTRLRGNRAALTRLVRNLLDNAVNYASTTIEITTHKMNNDAVVVVDDDGPGIPPNQRDRVFERFVRLDEARSRDSGGTGLGLALSKAIADSHGGTIIITTSPLGGARFTVTIPAGRQ